MKNSVTNNELIRTWENCYEVSLGNLKAYKRRLKELETWDKPLGTPSTDKNGKWREHVCKKIALRGLIEAQESNPKMNHGDQYARMKNFGW